MSSQDNSNDVLNAYKPRPWGEEIDTNSQGYSRPDPSSKMHIASREPSSKSGTGSSVIPWN